MEWHVTPPHIWRQATGQTAETDILHHDFIGTVLILALTAMPVDAEAAYWVQLAVLCHHAMLVPSFRAEMLDWCCQNSYCWHSTCTVKLRLLKHSGSSAKAAANGNCCRVHLTALFLAGTHFVHELLAHCTDVLCKGG